MKQIHSILSICFLLAALSARGQDLVWGDQINDSDTGNRYVYDQVTDRLGNTYIAGQFGGTVDFDPGPGVYPLVSLNNQAAFISKYDSSGALVWARVILSDTDFTVGSAINALALDDAGRVYALGYFYATTDFDPGPGVYNLVSALGPDMFVEQLDASGNFSWVIPFPGTYNITSKDIAVDAAGDILLTGTFGGGSFDFDPSPGVHNLSCTSGLDIFLLKINAAGSLLWASQVSGPSSEYPSSMALDADGSVYLTGYYYGAADFDPGAAVYNLSSNGYGDIFIAKFDGSGNLVWASSFGDTFEDVGVSIVCDKMGNTYTTGRFMKSVDFDPGTGVQNLISAGSYDAFILKLDSNGGYRWAKRVGGSNWDNGVSVSLGESSVDVATYFQDSVDLDPGAGSLYLGAHGKQQFGYISLDTSGNLNWAMKEDHAMNTVGNCYMAEDAAGYIYATGRFWGTIDCDPAPVVHNLSVADNKFSYFILKLKALAAPSAIPALASVDKNYSVYPNPANGTVYASAAEIIERVTVTDMAGRVIYEARPAQKNSSWTIPYPGVYMVSLVFRHSVAVEKIVVRGE